MNKQEYLADWVLRAQKIAHLGIWDQDSISNELWWSDETFRILGLEPQSIAPSFDKFLQIVHPDDRAIIIKETELTMKSDDHPYIVEYRILWPDNSERIVHEEALIERSETGSPIKVTGIIQDITDRKKEELLKEALIEKLKKSLSEIKTLQGIIPICSHCHKIRTDEGYWQRVDQYITEHTEAVFSHGMCMKCSDELYGGQKWYEKGKKTGEIKE